MVSLFLGSRSKINSPFVGTSVRSSRPRPYLDSNRFLKQMDGLDIDQFIHAVFPRLADVEPSSSRRSAKRRTACGSSANYLDKLT